jgi:hypothetical protein
MHRHHFGGGRCVVSIDVSAGLGSSSGGNIQRHCVMLLQRQALSVTRSEGPAHILYCCQSASLQQALFRALCCTRRRMWQEERGTAGSVSPNAPPHLPPIHQWHRGAAACLLPAASSVASDHDPTTAARCHTLSSPHQQQPLEVPGVLSPRQAVQPAVVPSLRCNCG